MKDSSTLPRVVPTKRSKTAGVYRIRLADGRAYIGSSVNVGYRWITHRGALRKGTHHSHYLQRAWDKYGEEAFVFELLEICEPIKEVLLAAEQEWIDQEAPVFNSAPVAGSSLGVKRRPETLEKMRIASLGRQTFLGQHHTEEAKQKMRGPRPNVIAWNRGIPMTEAAKENLRIQATGRKASSETLEKMSVAQVGRVHSAATKAKMSISAKERWAKIHE